MSIQGWEQMANLCKADFQTCQFKEELVRLCSNHEDIAWVVYFHNRENALKWMKNKVPALNGATPVSCFPNKAALLKQTLLAFPC